ncbi:MAG: ABC transporter substrate-binding protein [Oscillospiraceae bacterium]|jgi:iron complex transport system substrate-binding protein|nr:ABC transporter substrate-binding protein [Oscillospiraceae bacterium]
MKKLLAILLALALVFALAVSCAKNEETPEVPETPEIPTAITADRLGNPITLPEEINTIITFGAAIGEVLVELGVGDKIIATDTYSFDVAGLTADIPQFDMGNPDIEAILDLAPDVFIVTGMVLSQGSGADAYKPFTDAGICVVFIPNSESIEGIREDIRFLGGVVGAADKAAAVIAEMDGKIAAVKAIGDTIAETRSVFFTLADSSYLYSFGSGTFLNEIIEIIGARNIFADQTSWIGVSGEQVLDANPDVILTSVNYLPDPIADILSIPGFDAITAVQNGDVFYVDANASNRPSQNIVKALDEMARAIYPEYYN